MGTKVILIEWPSLLRPVRVMLRMSNGTSLVACRPNRCAAQTVEGARGKVHNGLTLTIGAMCSGGAHRSRPQG